MAGDATPDGMQRLLNSANWDADGVRDDLRSYIVEHLGEPGGVLIVDLCRHRDYAEAWDREGWRCGRSAVSSSA